MDSNKDEEWLDHEICQQMEKIVELLTFSGKQSLDEDPMKKFKKLCRKSDIYVKHAYHLLITQLEKNHSEVRLSVFQMIDQLFNRSHLFRELLVSDFQNFLDLTVETDVEMPLPPPKTIAKRLKSNTLKAIQQWQEKYGEAYKKLSIGYNYLLTCKQVDFNDIRTRTVAERRAAEEREQKKQNLMKTKLGNILKEIKEICPEIENAIKEVEGCLQLILPRPELFCVTDAETVGSSHVCSKTADQLEPSTSASKTIQQDSVDESGNYLTPLDNDSVTKDKVAGYSLSVASISSVANQNTSIQRDLTENNSSGSSFLQCSGEFADSEGDKQLIKENGAPQKATLNLSKQDSVSSEGDTGLDARTDNSDDEFEDVSDSQTSFVQQHGLFSRNYNLTINIGAINPCIRETEENSDIFTSLRDSAHLVKHKHIPLVIEWLEILTKNGAKESDIKSIIDLKIKIMSAIAKCVDLNIISSGETKRRRTDSDDDDDFEEVPEKEGFEPHIPSHLRKEYGLEAEEKNKAPEKFMASVTPQFWNMKTLKRSSEDPTSREANLAKIKRGATDSSIIYKGGKLRDHPSTSAGNGQQSASDKNSQDKNIPFLPFGVDLAHWGHQENIEAPLVVKYDSLHRFWTPHEYSTEKASQSDVAALTSRTFHYTGKFEPVKWKCRAPMPNGKLCERMDREKCPFHGKIIARNNLGHPEKMNDALELAKKAEKKRNDDVPSWQDPELQRDIEAATGLDLGSRRSKGKGKGKGKGKKKHPNLTDIKAVKNTCHSRLEKKVFNKNTLRRINSAMDAADYKRVRDKFGNQFNYTHSK